MRTRIRKYLTASIFGVSAASSVCLVLTVAATPAEAQLAVFDPHNYVQNVLTAARTLQQIDNQIRQLQNQATSLINQAKNLTTISFPELTSLTQTLTQINTLMGQAQSLQFRVSTMDQQFTSLFPTSFNQALTMSAQVSAAKTRLDTSMAAYKQTMTVQAQVVQNVTADGTTLNGIVSRSQGAEGGLQAQQATNQLLALAAKQQFQIQTLMAAQYRAEATEQARQAQAASDAQALTTKFLGSGTAYTPQ